MPSRLKKPPMKFTPAQRASAEDAFFGLYEAYKIARNDLPETTTAAGGEKEANEKMAAAKMADEKRAVCLTKMRDMLEAMGWTHPSRPK